MFRSGNPVLGEGTFEKGLEYPYDDGRPLPAAMTVNGAVLKTAVLLAIVTVGAAFTWRMTFDGLSAARARVIQRENRISALSTIPAPVVAATVLGAVAGLGLALVTCFFPKAAPVTAPLYAAAEGVFLGAVSAGFEYRYPGIAAQAAGLTAGTLAAMLAVYRLGLVKVNEKFVIGVMAATGGIALVYLADWLLRAFAGYPMPYIHETGLVGIGISAFVVGIAAFNLILDFAAIEEGEAARAPKYMEWYAAFGLLVTLVWLYLEMLRLLAKLRSSK
jgi:uncharacterized YccA/Bax inhibitor family protein